jgi:predicted GNAT family acetyltransferase
MTMPVIDNPARQRFELSLDGQTAFASYRREGDRLAVYHTEVPREFEATVSARPWSRACSRLRARKA